MLRRRGDSDAHSAIMSAAPAMASSQSSTPFLPTNPLAADVQSEGLPDIIILANGSRPFSRAIVARVRFLGLNGAYISSTPVIVSAISKAFSKAGVIAPAFSIASFTNAFRASSSRSDFKADSIPRTATSSSDPVRSFLYLLMNGTVAPSSSNSAVAFTAFSLNPSFSAILLYILFISKI